MRRSHGAALLLLTVVALRPGASANADPLPSATPPAVGAAAALEPPAAAEPAAADAVAETAAPPDDLPRERPLQYALSYRLDARSGAGAGEPALQLGGLEAEFVGSYGRKWEFGGQVPVASQLASSGRRMHFGTLFAVRKWRLGAPTVKFGQFVVPFSNLTSYDVHSRLIQSLYRYSLGVRIDSGVEVEGYLSDDTEWQLALTTGSGPYRFDGGDAPLVTGRISRKLDAGGNAVRLGLSAAGGTLPVYSLTSDPVSVEGSARLDSANKRRLALDAEIERGVDLFRVEGVVGTDDGRAANGLWAGWTRPLDARHSVETAVETWRQPEGDGRLWAAWLGAERRLDGARTARAALRWSRSREAGQHRSNVSVGAQFVRQF
jgi:hypothetical protein